MIWCPTYSLKPLSKTSKSALEKLFCPASSGCFVSLCMEGNLLSPFPPQTAGVKTSSAIQICVWRKKKSLRKSVPTRNKKHPLLLERLSPSAKNSDSTYAWRTPNQSKMKYKCRAALYTIQQQEDSCLQTGILQSSRNGLKNQIKILSCF